MFRKRKKKTPVPSYDLAGVKIKKIDLKAKLDRVFSLYIRLRDSMDNGYFKCISCGQIKPFKLADCGHYINRRHMATRYDEMNCNAQCSHCNRFMEGNIQNYRKGLIKKYSEQRVELLESQGQIVRKYTDFEMEELIKYYMLLTKQLKQRKCIN